MKKQAAPSPRELRQHPDAAAPVTSNLLILAATNVLFPSEPGARNSRKSRPHQRHSGSGLYGASGSPGRFRMTEMDLRVMGMRKQVGRGCMQIFFRTAGFFSGNLEQT